VFGSQYDQLLAHPWSQGLQVNPEALGLYLRFAHVPAPFGMIQDTHMLEPGSWLEADASGEITQGCYYHFPWDQTPDLEDEQALEAVDAALSSAVKRQLVSDVPLGAFLSGGIDSPLVVAKIREVAPDTPLRTFTIGTDDSATDETEDAIAYGRALGVEHIVERVSPDQALALLDDVNCACAEPFGDFSIFPTMLVTRLASREFKVMLSGDGGDELFWGYVQRSAPMIARAPEFARSPRARALRRRTQMLLGQDRQQRELRWSTIGHWQRQRHTHLPAGWLEKLFPRLPPWPADYDVYDYAGTEPEQTARWLRSNELRAHLPMVLLKVDRASMYNSLEVRVPLLDREMLDVAARVGWQSCIDTTANLGKLPLRRSLQRYVQRQSQNKRGFGIPMGQWLRTSLREVFEARVIDRPDILGVELDKRQIKALYQRHLKGQGDFGWGLWPLLSLCLWSDRAQQAMAASPKRLQVSQATAISGN
jgi:asparagine synthase (glutamine-hydrolysing)